jgi:hypothetical protein
LALRLVGSEMLSNSVAYLYVEDVVVDSVSPAFGKVGQETAVVVSGSGFTDGLFCSFEGPGGVGATLAPAAVTGGRSLACAAPAAAAAAVARLRVVAGPDDALSDVFLSFTYAVGPVVSRVYPLFGPSAGESVVNFVGGNFAAREVYICSFGDLDLVGSVVSSALVQCTAPAGSPAGGAVGLTLGEYSSFEDGAGAWEYTTTYQYVSPPEILAVSSLGPAAVVVKFAGAVDSSLGWGCLVGDAFYRGSVVSASSEVVCLSAPAAGGAAALSLCDETRSVCSGSVVLNVTQLAASAYTSAADEVCFASAESVLPLSVAGKPVGSPDWKLATTSSSMRSFVLDSLMLSRDDTTTDSSVSGDVCLPAVEYASALQSYFAIGSDEQDASDSLLSIYSSLRSDYVCKLGNGASCFSRAELGANATIELHASLFDSFREDADYFSSSDSADESVMFTNNSHVVLDHSDDFFVDPRNGSWVSLSGRFFPESAYCAMDGLRLPTVYLSPFAVQCFVPPLAELRSTSSSSAYTNDVASCANGSSSDCALGVTAASPLITICLQLDGFRISQNCLSMSYDVFGTFAMSANGRVEKDILSPDMFRFRDFLINFAGFSEESWLQLPSSRADQSVDVASSAAADAAGAPFVVTDLAAALFPASECDNCKIKDVQWLLDLDGAELSAISNETLSCCETIFADLRRAFFSIVSTSAQGAEEPAVADVSSVGGAGKMLLEPSAVPANTTFVSLHFYGGDFTMNDGNVDSGSVSMSAASAVTEWCVRFREQVSPCVVVSRTRCSCTLPTVSDMPGRFPVTLLENCQRPVFETALAVTAILQSPGTSSATATGGAVLTAVPVVSQVSPSAVPAEGSSVVTLTGTGLEYIKFCRFTAQHAAATDTAAAVSEDTVPVHSSSSTKVTCATPAFRDSGFYSLSISSDAVSDWVGLSAPFYVYTSPVVEYAILNRYSQATPMDSPEVIVFGHWFPAFLGVTCHMLFDHDVNSSSSSEGLVLSSTELICPVPYLSKRLMTELSVSFNGIDFTAVNISMVVHTQLHWQADNVVDVVGEAVPDADVVSPIDVTSAVTTFYRNAFCNGTDTISVAVDAASASVSSADGVTCSYRSDFALDSSGDVLVLQPVLVSGSVVVCPVPASPPGKLLLTAAAQQGALSVQPVLVEVTCMLQPVVNVVSFDGINAHNDGLFLVRIVGLHLGYGDYFCSLNYKYARAAVDSATTLLCLFDSPMAGLNKLSVHSGDTVLFQQSLCLSEATISQGLRNVYDAAAPDSGVCNAGADAGADTATDADAADALLSRFVKKDINTIWPSSGVSGGGTAVEIVAEGVAVSDHLSCLFGDVSVPAFVTGADRVYCEAPAHAPGAVSLELVNGNVDATRQSISSWCCSNYFYFPELKLTSVMPAVIPMSGGIISVRAVELPEEGAMALYCHINLLTVVPAYRLDAFTVTCLVPALSARGVVVFLGSDNDVWSNPMSIESFETAYDVPVVPRAVRFQGGTKVILRVPARSGGAYVLHDSKKVSSVMCYFDDVPSPAPAVVEASPDSDGEILFACVTPAGGQVGPEVRRVVAVDTQSPDTHSNGTSKSVIAVGLFVYVYPAEPVSVVPSEVIQNSSSTLLVRGTDFLDSSELACVFEVFAAAVSVDETVSVPATFISFTMISCALPAFLTLEGNHVQVRVTNNGIDVSAGAMDVRVKPLFNILSVAALRGYTVGDSVVTISFLNIYTGKLFCDFGTERVIALKANERSDEYICVSPPNAVGKVAFVVTDGFTALFESEYTYVALPVLSAASPASILSGRDNRVGFAASGVDAYTHARVRTASGRVVSKSCAEEAGGLACVIHVLTESSSSITTAGPKTLYVDVSTNGFDFISGVFVMHYYAPVSVAAANVPATVYRNGGLSVQFTTSGVNPLLESTACRFSSGAASVSAAAAVIVGVNSLSDGVLSCRTPASLPPGDAQVSLLQGGVAVSEPYSFSVVPVPTVANIFPVSVSTGVLTPISITFAHPILMKVSIFCQIQGDRYEMRFLSSDTGICSVQPLAAGIVDLYFMFSDNEVLELAGSIDVSNIVDQHFSINTTAVMKQAATHITVLSDSCSIPTGAVAALNGNQFALLDGQRDDTTAKYCSASFTVRLERGSGAARAGANYSDSAVFSLCGSASSCAAPLFSRRLVVLSEVIVSGRFPAAGPAHGGTTVDVYGVGFGLDSTDECLFGASDVPAMRSPTMFISSAHIRCVAPAGEPGSRNLISLRRHAHVVSSSIAYFTYVAELSSLRTSVSYISAAGGNAVVAAVSSVPADVVFSCRFADQFVAAVVLNATSLRCVSPPIGYADTVGFALSIDSKDVSSEVTLLVQKPVAVLNFEPLDVVTGAAATFSLIFDRDVQDMLLTSGATMSCRLTAAGAGAGAMVSQSNLTVEGSEAWCAFPGVATGAAGSLSFGLYLDDNVVFKHEIRIRSSLLIRRAAPLLGFTGSATLVSLQSVDPVDTSTPLQCCFGEQRSDAIVVDLYHVECYAPVLLGTEANGGNIGPTLAPLGLAGPDGSCENTGLSFQYIPDPVITNLQPVSGPVMGGTKVLLSFDRALSQNVFVRMGSGNTASQANKIDSHTVAYATRQQVAGPVTVEVSFNGVDFISMSVQFEFVPIMVLAESRLPDYANASDALPVIWRIEPDVLSSSSVQSVSLYGSGFNPTSQCVLSQSMPLLTTFVSDSELSCTVPAHAPGYEEVTVANALHTVSLPRLVAFSFSPVVNHLLKASPYFGPPAGETSITVYGSHLLSLKGVVYCLMGHDWVFAVQGTDSSVVCVTPRSTFSGQIDVRLATADKELLPGSTVFEYINTPLLFDAQPVLITTGTDVLVVGVGFTKSPKEFLKCLFGSVVGVATVISDTRLICTVPSLVVGKHALTVSTNGQSYAVSGIEMDYNVPERLLDIFPSSGPALRGSTVVSIYGSNFKETVDMSCIFGDAIVPAVFITQEEIKCRTPSHRPGRVNVSVEIDGNMYNELDGRLEFVFLPDPSVDKISPPFGYTAGGYPVFIFGSNIVNTSALGCKFADMYTRGMFISNTTMVCLAPSPLGRSELKSKTVSVEITANGYDYTANGVKFFYSEPCDEGFFCPGLTRQLCPNGTYCPANSRNFTMCPPGTFQAREGGINCASCPTGYICPDHGMARPVICPVGQICDTVGLRASGKNCPNGHYCLSGTKAESVSEFQGDTSGINGSSVWATDVLSNVVYFDDTKFDFSYTAWPPPAVGQSRTAHPPSPSCDGIDCFPGNTKVNAEAPFPCPIGHYCRAGVGSQIPLPKNFSAPQRCFDGFFCPRGSINPEGAGPCPTGYFCPTQLDAVTCPRGHYCPGVGNKGPVECYPGTYNPFEQQSNCTVCPTGHICPGWGSLLPEVCPAGFVCASIGLSFPLVLCPAGYYCNDGTLTIDPSDPTPNRPHPCVEGEFCLGGVKRDVKVEWIPKQPWGATAPQGCSEGTYCQTASYESSGSGLCFRGHYCKPNVAFPIQTPIGNFASGLGSVAPTLCFPGTYAPLQAQVNCLPCPAGHSCTSYGTYIPSICPVGTYRSLVDAVTCRLCVTGTYSFDIGVTDISLCLPCPPGRICGIQGMSSMSLGTDCPAGFVCGFGTDRQRQFLHESRGGYHTTPKTVPSDLYDSICIPGYYCPAGTTTALALRAKCAVGYYCPAGTSVADGKEVKCPRVTTSQGGARTVNECIIFDVDVCDKAGVDIKDPMVDLTYYPEFSYTLLDDSGSTLEFTSDQDAINPTGEVVVVRKVMPINESSSSEYWKNDTIEAFRSCPSYGTSKGGIKATIIGRNFKDTGLNFCRWRRCISADSGKGVRLCRNRGLLLNGDDGPIAGTVSDHSYTTQANFISETRMECVVPVFEFEDTIFPTELKGTCLHNSNGTLMYRRLLGVEVSNTSSARVYEELSELVFACSDDDIDNGYCLNSPEAGLMMNPCYTAQFIVEVTNDGSHYSGGDNLQGSLIKSSVLNRQDKGVTYEFANYTRIPTFATYMYVYDKYWYDNEEIYDMEKDLCSQARFSEEMERKREVGYFQLLANEAAHVHVDLRHIPSNLVYGQHFRLAIFVQPSRCTQEICNSNRVRITPQENTPCKLPKGMPDWFTDASVPKNLANNLTIYALDDTIFKVEIHILNGLYAPYVPYFKNCTTVRLAKPERSRQTVSSLNRPTRRLSEYISFENRRVPESFFFAVAYFRENSGDIALPLNLPPTYADYERGRVLIMYNKSLDAVQVPNIKDPFVKVSQGDSFFDLPASTADDSKVLADAYFETFHGLSQAGGIYSASFQSLITPYLLYFSNCQNFDSYIPVWLLLEGKECELPDREEMGDDWFRFRYPPLVDFDDIKYVSPFDFFQDPIADYCLRTLYCQYEEDLEVLDIVPRWFEGSTGDTLMHIFRDPIDYQQYTGRADTYIHSDDAGGQKYIDEVALVSSDLFISVTVDRIAADLFPGGCILQCFPRTMVLDIGYYQYDLNVKRIVYINLIFETFDYNQSDTSYEVSLEYYPLSWFELLIYFAFSIDIYVILFIVVGGLAVAVAFAFWIIVRLTTHLQNPPELKFWNMLVLIAPPPSAGVLLGSMPVMFLTIMAFFLISGDRFVDDATEVGSWYLDEYQLEYTLIDGKLDPVEQERARNGRLGLAFVVIGFCVCFAGCRIFLPKRVSKREIEMALKRDKRLAEKEDIWAPTLWKRSNLMLCSVLMAFLMVMIVEFSIWSDFGTYFWTILFMLKFFGYFIEIAFDAMLKESLLMTPMSSCLSFVEGLVTLGADDLVDFILGFFIDFLITVVERTYIDPHIGDIFDFVGETIEKFVKFMKNLTPAYLRKKKKKGEKESKEVKPKRELEDIGANVETTETVEPILDSYSGVCSDAMGTFFTPYVIYLLIYFRVQIVLPEFYGIAEKDMLYYLFFQLIIIVFTVLADVILLSCQELFQGWKVYEYLVYSKYRFLQRESRWKGMEDTLDECLDETVRTLDQMCFSSQFYFMLTVHVSGIIYFVFGIEIMLRWEYNAFSDTASMAIIFWLIGCSIVLEILFLFLAKAVGLWRIKHENTAWLIEQVEEDDVDLPGWEDVKGASHDAYLMNQRITSETFRLKFLNYNRAWLIQQLPTLLTPRTLRRSRPYLISQFARIISSRRGDISDDSDQGEKEHKFGPVALTAPSRALIRWWLGKARRRLRLKHVVEPLIRRARGVECEQCLSRKQLNVEYEIDVDEMVDMYEAAYPEDDEIDQVQWKAFWSRNQVYHTVCLMCLTKRKEKNRGGGGGGGGPQAPGLYTPFDDAQEQYPDWGPVFLTPASKAILLNWYRKAQRSRAGRKGVKKTKDKAPRAISDDEGDDVPPGWTKQMAGMQPASKAIAVKWMRTARAQLQKKAGKGGDHTNAGESYRGGKRSKALRK